MAIQLKVCGLKYPENLKDVLALGPDYLGFIFYPPSPRYMAHSLDPEKVRLISSARKVGVFVNASEQEIFQQARAYALDYIQLHGQEAPEIARGLRRKGLRVIKVFSVGEKIDWQPVGAFVGAADAFLFDTQGQRPGGNGIPFDWELLATYPYQVPFFLSGGIGLDNAARVKNLSLDHLLAFDVNSRFELEPGRKDISLLKSLQQLMQSH